MNVQILIRMLLKRWQLQRRDRWTHEQLEAYQAKALRRLRQYVYARSPFYQQFHRGLTDRPLQALPVLTKGMMMECFDELVTDRTIRRTDVEAHIRNLRKDEYLGRYWVSATSGCTGSPGLFLFDPWEWATVLASFVRAQNMMSLEGAMLSAVVASSTPWHMSARISATVRRAGELRIDASEPIQRIAEKLNIWQPEVLVAYASILYLLADEQLDGRLEIEPSYIISTSEVLTDEMRQRIEKAWKAKLFNQYVSTEVGAIAAECDLHQGLHLFEDLAIVEVVDENNRPVPPGVYGDKLLLSVLFNRTQPLIRYELSDSVRMAADPCPCGRPYPLIEDIQGRREEILSLPATTGDEIKVHPHIFHQILDALPVSEWQVVRDASGLRILLSNPSNQVADSELVDALQRKLEKQGAIVPPITVKHVLQIPRNATGKVSRIASRVN
ncbi:MAG: phenylacetate--CoA ligase family protein [Hydrococcus sp. C42_A2020_068]|uniref:phenylacetate--CoA ligase family protein n=1 Tax=Pleurocapsa sp. PCC 7327 TaxID=118163 RepID=UPI00029FBD6F|nr:phenylacetate--CoA ligase family protein [Pleurocapsa sp. PCC 7327]AFY76226.1 coenzyme F390 synthetase [Pleurocapsa sp. PCC 7327]MBF2018962.1 phenylacetate--CoA ligase family protein [Hydrococcus sp. C42_A2020_068]